MFHDGTVVESLSQSHDIAKRGFDLIVSCVSIAILAPLLLTLFLLIKLTSKGSGLFVQQRYGLNGQIFDCYKFRTMYSDDRGIGFSQCVAHDPRVTPIGRVLRSTSMDELPQLFNVFLGTMSLVGPRPHPLKLDDEFAKHIPGYRARFFVKPGITGLAQITGSRGPTPTVDDMARRIRADRSYVRHRSFALDLGILCATIPCVIKGTNAF
jgi:putative colanic acid biosysnthesis UDP-glucose lipid carrier transferase